MPTKWTEMVEQECRRQLGIPTEQWQRDFAARVVCARRQYWHEATDGLMYVAPGCPASIQANGPRGIA